MPDRGETFTVESLDVRWKRKTLHGGGALRFDDDGIHVSTRPTSAVRAAYEDIAGASWREGRLRLYGDGDDHIDAGLDATRQQAWVTLLSRTCPVPEFTRGLRRLGSPRGGHAAAQERFFAPLLKARRRLEDAHELDERVEAFDADVLSSRLAESLTTIAAELHPDSAPDQRALEAQLQDCARPLQEALAAVGRAARAFRDAPDAGRFTAWRRWVRSVHEAFAEADRDWGAALRFLPAAPSRRRRWWQRRGKGTLLLLLTAFLPPPGIP